MRRVFRFFVITLTVLVGCGFLFFKWANAPLETTASPVEFVVPQGGGFSGVPAYLAKSGVAINRPLFSVLARIRAGSAPLRFGVYAVDASSTPMSLIEKLVSGDVVTVSVQIPEGFSFRQLRARLNATDGLRHDSAGLSDRDVLRRIGSGAAHPEGRFFPETYKVDKGASDLVVLEAAMRAMQKQVQAAWEARAPGGPLRSVDDLLVLASIIEKETGLDRDRPEVSAVFHNRLRIGMRLQTDPTVIYGLGESFDGNLRKRDLLADTPYNTYTRSGLPPTPISMPGKASLLAAAIPAASDALYFVARGDGSSQFSRDLNSHNQAVNQYQRGGR